MLVWGGKRVFNMVEELRNDDIDLSLEVVQVKDQNFFPMCSYLCEILRPLDKGKQS